MLSSIPLCGVHVMDTLRARYSWAEAPHSALRVAFAVLFLLMRIVLWVPLGVNMGIDCVRVLTEGVGPEGGPKAPCPNPYEVWYLIAANAFLMALQLFWGWKVLQGLVKAVAKLGGARKAKGKRE